jgi:acetyl esterase
MVDVDLARNIAENSKIVLIQVDYRLCPENPFPAGLDDCCEAYEWASITTVACPMN